MTAKIKLNAASGGGSISIQAPSSSSNNRVISLPDIADGTLLTSQSSLDSTKLSPAISAGITEADQWRVSSSFDVNGSSFISSNWERVDITGWDKIGTGMSESSGVFTFPSTGIWNVIFWDTVRPVNNTTMYAGVEYYYTVDNGTYNNVANFYEGIGTTAFFGNISGSHMFDISNVSTHKLKFRATAANTTTYSANTSETQLSATFIRLGDT